MPDLLTKREYQKLLTDLRRIDAPARDTLFGDLVANSSPTNPSSER
jgi:hypothetical protein